MMKVKEKICHFWTKHIFTCGHNATSRGEGTNSRLKGHGGCFKKVLLKSDLDRSVERVLSLVNEQENSALTEIKTLISGNKHWSDFVNKEWEGNNKTTDQMLAQQNQAFNDPFKLKFDVYYKGKEKKFSVVTIPKVSGAFPPSCSCGKYKSLKIPCTCICTVYNLPSLTGGLFKEHNLENRWRLKSHPLYDKAKSHLGITVGETQAIECEQSIATNDKIFAYDQSKFASVKYLTTESARHAVLKEVFDKTARLAKHNKENYRKMVLWMNAMYNHFNHKVPQPTQAQPTQSQSQKQSTSLMLQETNENTSLEQQLTNEDYSLEHTLNGEKSTRMVLQQINQNSTLPPLHKEDRKRGRVSDSQVKNLAKHQSKKQKKKLVTMTY